MESDGDVSTIYSYSFRARATTEEHVKIGGFGEPILALVYLGFEINILSKKVYESGKWSIDTNLGWVLRVANDERCNIYEACPVVCIKNGDMEVCIKNFFVQNQESYQAILEQPYINATRMEASISKL